MSKHENELDIERVDALLKVAGIYDENLSLSNKLRMYEFIKSSGRIEASSSTESEEEDESDNQKASSNRVNSKTSNTKDKPSGKTSTNTKKANNHTSIQPIPNLSDDDSFEIAVNNSKSLSEEMFDNLKASDTSKEKEESERFEKTLQQADEELSFSSRSKPLLSSNNTPIKARKPLHDEKKAATPSSSDNKENKSVFTAKNFYGGDKSKVESPSTTNEPKVPCPICSISFPESKIEQHAANCTQYPSEPSTSKMANYKIPFKFKSSKPDSALKSVTELLPENNKENTPKKQPLILQNPPPKDKTVFIVDDVEDPKQFLPVIYHPPKYDLPFYFDPRLDNMGWLERAEIIALCFEKMRWKHFESLRRKCVGWCKPVLLTAKRKSLKDGDPLRDSGDSGEDNGKEEVEKEANSSLDENINDAKLNNNTEDECNNVMRNNNTEEKRDENYNQYDFKELPVEEEPVEYVTQSGRATKRKLYIVDDEDSSDTSETKKSKSTNKTKSAKQKKSDDDVVKINRKNKKAPTLTKHKLIDVDEDGFIETRKKIKPAVDSKSVKKYSPLTVSSPASYSEKMFDKLKDDNAKRKEQELERDRFLKTLEPESEEYGLTMLGEENEAVENQAEKEDENVTRRRIVPPNPFRKKLKLGLTKTNTETETQVVKEQQSPTCPTCGKQFSESEINSHAWLCSSTTTSSTCWICQKKIPPDEDFVAHQKYCSNGE